MTITGNIIYFVLTIEALLPGIFAYIDPGTGSIILQAIIGAIAGAAIAAKLYWHRIIRFFGFGKKTGPDADQE